ncbi:MAG TPA: signal recognition particle-docking protein FtsY [Candidatus Nanoarchaeia archaeon]|nr:signal recognition particle-docking protein FtsY [Candidatus Nanoarchaeia archaeon]
MFKFLKDKLKSALAKITKKVEEEAPEEVIEQVVEQPKTTKKPKAEKPSKPKKEIKPRKEKKSKKEIPIIEEPVKEEDLPHVEPVAPELKPEEQPAEKKGFFSKLFKKKEVVEEHKEVKEEQQEAAKPQELVSEEAVEEKKGFFGKLKEKIVTKKITPDKFAELFWELEVAMLENNVAVAVIDRIKTELQHRLVDKPLQRGQIEAIIQKCLKESIEQVLKIPTIDVVGAIKKKSDKPYVIVFVGVNGAGKTTTIARVAHLLKSKGLRCVLVAADTFRAGAKEQLLEWGKRLNLKVISHDYGSDPAAVCFDGIAYGKKDEADVVLIDTAGRQHSNVNLVEQMKKIVRVAKPDLKVFIGESIAGNDVVEQAEQFHASIGIDGIILTKADVDDKGGAMISVSYVTGKPILYLGVGQNVEDLEPFSADSVLKTLGL